MSNKKEKGKKETKPKMHTIDIKGKAYVQVSERIRHFNEICKNGRITTRIISHDGGVVLMQAIVVPDVKEPKRYFTGYATEWQDKAGSMVNKTSYIENCETSAVGRALGMMGIGILEGFASADEVKTAKNKEKKMENLFCSVCKKNITGPEKGYSLKMFGKQLCRGCQVNERKQTEYAQDPGRDDEGYNQAHQADPETGEIQPPADTPPPTDDDAPEGIPA